MKTSHIFGSTQSITAAALQFLHGCHLQDRTCFQIYSFFFPEVHFLGFIILLGMSSNLTKPNAEVFVQSKLDSGHKIFPFGLPIFRSLL